MIAFQKIIIDCRPAVMIAFQVNLKPVFASGGESVDIFQANHSFTWRNCVLRNVIMVQGGRSCAGARVAPAEKFGVGRKF